jgi:hypothetical protein
MQSITKIFRRVSAGGDLPGAAVDLKIETSGGVCGK